jgi:hypothetical protein
MTRNGTDQPSLTGIGYITPNVAGARVFLHSDSTKSYLESNHLMLCLRNFHLPSNAWLFMFHDACWNLLKARVSQYGLRDEARLAACLFNILYCTPINLVDLTLKPGHNYGGAFDERMTNFPSSLMRLEYPGLFVQPIPGLSDWQSIFGPQNYEESETMDRSLLPARGGRSASDIFIQLPLELLWMILSDLPSKDVCSLRLSSRAIANISGPTQLPQSFWASRFVGDNEMAFVMACGESPKLHDWRAYYSCVKYKMHHQRDFAAVANKARIWGCLGMLSYAIKDMMAHDPQINPKLSIDDMLRGSFPNMSVIVGEGRLTSGKLLPYDDPGAPLRRGCRELSSTIVTWPQAPRLDDVTIRVSFTQLNSTRYISGLRIVQNRDVPKTSFQEFSRAGLIVQSNEHSVSFGKRVVFRGVEVATHRDGIVGLRFCTLSALNWRKHPVGDFKKSRKPEHPEPANFIAGLLLGFDVRLPPHCPLHD